MVSVIWRCIQLPQTWSCVMYYLEWCATALVILVHGVILQKISLIRIATITPLPTEWSYSGTFLNLTVKKQDAKSFGNVIHPPFVCDNQSNTAVICLLPPPELNLLIGPVSKMYTILEAMWPCGLAQSIQCKERGVSCWEFCWQW